MKLKRKLCYRIILRSKNINSLKELINAHVNELGEVIENENLFNKTW